ncbi:MAG: hypothetical protein LBK06_10075 [Planctomycetaceae bacterium]|jgi:hypothetical protein|nr:hypothetical protein [Planctomycetaceae bacterium]
MDIFQNPFSNFNFQSAQKTIDVGTSSKVASSVQSLPSVASSWNTKDEYIPSASSSSGTYKRSSISTLPLASGETVRSGEVTDAMREEMKIGDSYWSAMDLLPIAYKTFNEIVHQVLDEKGIADVGYSQEYIANLAINPDGIFIFSPNKSGADGIDPEFTEEVCLALESALNSSSLNIKENPHLFVKESLPSEYDPVKWGRTIDREEWSHKRASDFSEFIKELRSDIYDKFSDLQIVDFSMKIDDQGKLTITDVKTEGNDPNANMRAAERMNRGLTGEIKEKAEYLGLLMLSAQSINGDVIMEGTILEPFDDGSRGNIEQFKHEILITSDSNYKVVRTEDQPNRRAKK